MAARTAPSSGTTPSASPSRQQPRRHAAPQERDRAPEAGTAPRKWRLGEQPQAGQGRRAQARADKALPRGQKGCAPQAGQGGHSWPVSQALFPPLTAAAMQALELLPQALHKVWPLNAAHRRSLPADIAELSRLLTTERQELQRPYWQKPAAVSAYLYYFLPWNLVRLCRLLAALPLPAPQEVAGADGRALLMDAGSGPLSLPLALWLARPEWRAAPISVLALDSVARPLALGRELMQVWAALMQAPAWPVYTATGGLDALPAEARALMRKQEQHDGTAPLRPWLMTAANVLNELRPVRTGRHGQAAAAEVGPQEEDDMGMWGGDGLEESAAQAWRDGPLARRMDGLLCRYAPFLYGQDGSEEMVRESRPEQARSDQPEQNEIGQSRMDHTQSPGHAAGRGQAAMLFVEPGTRLGGQTIMRLRQLATEGGLHASVPCGHTAPCALLAGQGGRTWCHFTFAAQAPRWLEKLSEEAGLPKTALSLAPLLLQAPKTGQAEKDRIQPEDAAAMHEAKGLRLRVLSSPFAVPRLRGLARYACSEAGLLLLEDAAELPAGAALTLPLPASGLEHAPRDAKSWARILRVPAAQANRADSADRGNRANTSAITAQKPMSKAKAQARHSRPPREESQDRPDRKNGQGRQAAGAPLGSGPEEKTVPRKKKSHGQAGKKPRQAGR